MPRSSTPTRIASARSSAASSSASTATACTSTSASNAEGFVPRENLIPREPIRTQDRIKAFLKEVRSEPRGPQLFLSRTAPEFLIELFKLEVPEVGQGLIQILGAARDAGVRAKIAVKQPRPAHRPGRRLRRHARLARAGGLQRDRRRARRHHPLRGQPGAVRHQRDAAGRGHLDRRRRGLSTRWTSRSPRRSCRRRSAAAARTSGSPRELTGWELNIMSESGTPRRRARPRPRHCGTCS